jgi:hypothetical protein
MLALVFGDAFAYFHGQSSGWAFVTPLYGDTASLRGNNPAAMRAAQSVPHRIFSFSRTLFGEAA